MTPALFMHIVAGLAHPRIYERTADRETLRAMGASDTFLNLSNPGDFMVLNGIGHNGRERVGGHVVTTRR